MIVKAQVKHIRTSPRKVRLVVNAIRGLNVNEALNQLKFINKKATGPVEKLLRSGIANAVNNFGLDQNNLLVKEIKVDEGRTLRRWMPRAHGRATILRKRSSHITLVLGEIKDSGEIKAKKQKIEAPVKLGAEKKEDKKVKETKEENKEETKKEVKPKDNKKEALKNTGAEKGLTKKIFRKKVG